MTKKNEETIAPTGKVRRYVGRLPQTTSQNTENLPQRKTAPEETRLRATSTIISGNALIHQMKGLFQQNING